MSLRSFGRGRRGAQAVEFALVLPVLMLLAGGTVDYGWFYDREMSVVQAVREGGRAASLVTATSTQTVCEVAADVVDSRLTAAGLHGGTVSAAVSASGPNGELMLSVSTSVPYQPLFGFMPAPAALVGSYTVRLDDQSVSTC